MGTDSGRPAVDRDFGREAFGADPANYHAARPDYPDMVWAALRERAGLGAGVDVLEIGAGTGLATRELLAHRPRRLVAVEPDLRLAAFLRGAAPDGRLEVLQSSFEDADLPPAGFDLVASATAFHWLDAVPALKRIHRLLRPGGAVALWWNVFGDASRPDPFHEATRHLFKDKPASLSSGDADTLPHALDQEARPRDFLEAGFTPDPPQLVRWVLPLDPDGVRGLYATFSNITVLPPAEQRRMLESLADIAAHRFRGHVERNMTTAIYTARR